MAPFDDRANVGSRIDRFYRVFGIPGRLRKDANLFTLDDDTTPDAKAVRHGKTTLDDVRNVAFGIENVAERGRRQESGGRSNQDGPEQPVFVAKRMVIQAGAAEQRVRAGVEPLVVSRVKHDIGGVAITPRHFDVATTP